MNVYILKVRTLASDSAAPIVLAVIAAVLQFHLIGHKEFSLWDEGYLWYGAQ